MSSNLAPWPYSRRPLLINGPRPVPPFIPVVSSVPITRQPRSQSQPQLQLQPQPPQTRIQMQTQNQNQSDDSQTSYSGIIQPATDPNLAPWPYGTSRTSSPSQARTARSSSSPGGRPPRVLHLPPTLRIHISSSQISSTPAVQTQTQTSTPSSRQTATTAGSRLSATYSIYEELPPYPYPHVDSPAYTETQA